MPECELQWTGEYTGGGRVAAGMAPVSMKCHLTFINGSICGSGTDVKGTFIIQGHFNEMNRHLWFDKMYVDYAFQYEGYLFVSNDFKVYTMEGMWSKHGKGHDKGAFILRANVPQTTNRSDDDVMARDGDGEHITTGSHLPIQNSLSMPLLSHY